MPTPKTSAFARGLTVEGAFAVLATARRLKAQGKDVVELEIGDSPFPTTPAAKQAGMDAIAANRTNYGPSVGLPEFRAAAARCVQREFGLEVSAENVVVASGAKPFEQYFAETFLEAGDGVLIFSPHFPTYEPNLLRRGARPVLEPLLAEHDFRPQASAIERFLKTDPRPRAVFLNSPHNPTGGVATRDDLKAIADVVRGTNLIVFSDEPYCHMVWSGRHESLLSQPGMLDQTVAAYTFSKSYSMSGWRIGFALAHPSVVEVIGKLINTTASCSPPFVQLAATAALDHDAPQRDADMARFHAKVIRLASALRKVEGVNVIEPAGTFYVFPDVRAICNRLGLTSEGLALFLLEGADEHFGVACLGGESFGAAGRGFLRFSCAEPDDRIDQAVAFLSEAIGRVDRVRSFLRERPAIALETPYKI